MENCAICTYLDINDCNSDGKYWCDKNLERHYPTDPKCSKFCKAYGRSDSAVKNILDNSNSNYGSGCYLTTMLCSILNLNDDNLYLKTIRNFRKNILQKDDKYKSLLVEYDIIGPKIAEALSNDPLKKTIATRFFNKYIVDIFYYIINNDIDKAIELYVEMTNSLKTFYNLNNYNVTIDEINNADILESGHGVYLKKKITN